MSGFPNAHNDQQGMYEKMACALFGTMSLALIDYRKVEVIDNFMWKMLTRVSGLNPDFPIGTRRP